MVLGKYQDAAVNYRPLYYRLTVLSGNHGEYIGEIGVPYPESKMQLITAALIEGFLDS